MGDRYLYPILPGLIGGALFALRAPVRDLTRRLGTPREWIRTAAVAGALVLLVVLAIRSHQRAPVFQTSRTMMMDAALNYPDGIQAHLLRGFRAAREGDAREAAQSYAQAVERGFTNLQSLASSPGLAAVREHPSFQAVIGDLADRTITRIEAREEPSQMELVALAQAYELRGKPARAIHAYEQALQREGPLAASVRRHLQQLQHQGAVRRIAE